LKIRRGSAKRADGSPYAVPIWVAKTRKYGQMVSEECVSRTRCVLVVGAHDSGKSRVLGRLHEHAEAIYSARSNAPALWLSALRPLAGWVEFDHLAAWWETLPAAEGSEKIPWDKLPLWARAEHLPNYLQDTGAVLFIDDAHKLSGRKLQIARECALTARLWVASASQENRIAPNLRSVMLRRDPQTFRLDSEVAYDATTIVMWIMIALSVGMGAWEIAVVLGGLKMLGSGRRAARQE
jgi:hypothetical protein